MCGQAAVGDGTGVPRPEDPRGELYLCAAGHAVFLYSLQRVARDVLEGGRSGGSHRHAKGIGRGAAAAGEGVSGHAGSVRVDAGDRDGEPFF